jgi:hypothetical protein
MPFPLTFHHYNHLTRQQLKPFVAMNIDKPTKTHEYAASVTGKMYLDAWKTQGGDI